MLMLKSSVHSNISQCRAVGLKEVVEAIEHLRSVIHRQFAKNDAAECLPVGLNATLMLLWCFAGHAAKA